MRAPRLLIAVASLALAAACGIVPPPVVSAPLSSAPVPSSAATAEPGHGSVAVLVTFYGGLDNDPPGSAEIAHPNSRHAEAGGTGTYADPVTVASDPRELPPGTLLYEPRLRLYLVMEDDCAECVAQWETARAGHIDIWTARSGAGLIACEEALTPDVPVVIEVNPPPGRPVDTRPLYAADGTCRAAG